MFECDCQRDSTLGAQRHENQCLVLPLCVDLRRAMTENTSAFHKQEGNLRTVRSKWQGKVEHKVRHEGGRALKLKNPYVSSER